MTVFLAMLLGFAVMSIGTETACAAISQDDKDVYLIGSYTDLKEFAQIVNGGNTAACARLTADIECTDKTWVPIGKWNDPYTGTFDGNSKTIEGLSNGDSKDNNQGLFGGIGSAGTVKSISLKNVSIQGKNTVGGVAAQNYGTIENCHTTGTVSGSDGNDVGGVAAENYGTIENCSNAGDVMNISVNCNTIGGVAGYNVGTIINCYNTGDVSGNKYVGGVAGRNDMGTITNCYNTGDVSGNEDVGGVAGGNGLIAYDLRGTITNCYYDNEKCTLTEAIGSSNGTVTNVTGLKTKEMTGTTCTAYDSWKNFYAVWKLTDSYPILDPHDHMLTYAKKESCVDPAHVEGYTCSTCGKHYSDKDGMALIPDADWTIPVTGHKYGAWTKLNATQHQKVCQHDKSHVVKENHKWDGGKVTKKATEKATGVRTYTCTVCKATKTETIPKLKPTAPKTSGTPLAKAAVKKKSMTIGWNRIQGAEGYDIFFSTCNHRGKKIACKNVKTIKGNKTFKWTKSGLKKGTAYKFYVRAYVTKNGKKTYVSKSPMFHAYTANGTKNYTNAKSVKVNKARVTLKKGETFKIKAKVKKVNKKKKLMPKSHAPKLRYMTSDSRIATVSKSGRITAKGSGTCTIVAFAHNGVSKSIKVTVK